MVAISGLVHRGPYGFGSHEFLVGSRGHAPAGGSDGEDAARGASLVPPPAAIARLSVERVNVVPAGRAEGTRDAFASLAAPDEVVSGTAALADETRDWLGGAARPRRR